MNQVIFTSCGEEKIRNVRSTIKRRKNFPVHLSFLWWGGGIMQDLGNEWPKNQDWQYSA